MPSREKLADIALLTWDKHAHSPRIEGEPGLDRAYRGMLAVVDAILKAQEEAKPEAAGHGQ